MPPYIMDLWPSAASGGMAFTTEPESTGFKVQEIHLYGVKRSSVGQLVLEIEISQLGMKHLNATRMSKALSTSHGLLLKGSGADGSTCFSTLSTRGKKLSNFGASFAFSPRGVMAFSSLNSLSEQLPAIF